MKEAKKMQDLFEKGRYFYDMRKRKCHYVTDFVDKDCTFIVYRFWLKHKQYWVYKVEPDWVINEYVYAKKRREDLNVSYLCLKCKRKIVLKVKEHQKKNGFSHTCPCGFFHLVRKRDFIKNEL